MPRRFGHLLLLAGLILPAAPATAAAEPAETAAPPAPARAEAEQVVDWASAILEEIARLPPDKRAQFDALVRDAQGFAIFPNVAKAGFILANISGRGVLIHREADGGWSLPILLSLRGTSVGPQIGAMSSDVLVVFRTQAALRSLGARDLRGVDVQSGPGGGAADIESYHTRRGLVLGQSIDKTTLFLDETGNESLYGRGIRPGAISQSTRAGLRPPPCVQKFVEQANRFQGRPAATMQWR